jgi:PIN domain nuclease of toxin-antitoxin system
LTLLLDTHVLLWALLDPRRLSPATSAMLVDPANTLLVSVVSGWEIAIKQSLGKLVLPGEAETWLPPACAAFGVSWIPLALDDALRVRALPWHHRDPFDRLLVAQAYGGRRLVTADPAFTAYGVPVIRA